MPEFLKTIPHEYILLPNIKGSDAIWGVGKNWSLEEAKHKLTPDRYITCCYNLKDTNYAVIDIDTDDYSLEQLYQDTEIDSCYVKGNTKGLHVWVEMEHGKEGKFKKNIVKCSNLCEMDYLGEKVFERVGKEWVGDVPAYLQPSQLNKCFKQEKFMIKLPTASQEPAASAPELLYKLINMVSQEYCDDRSDWLKIVYAMKKCGVGEEFARDWSKKSDRYTEDGFTNAWEQYSAEQITATEGTIRHYAKKSNPEEYAKLKKQDCPIPDGCMDIPRLINLKSDIEITETSQEQLDEIEKYSAKEQKKARKELKDKEVQQVFKRFNEEMDLKTAYFEEYHAKILKPAGFVRFANKEVNMLSAKDLTLQYENVRVQKPSGKGIAPVRFTDEWRLKEDIKTYNDVDFYPEPKDCPKDTLNTFTGFKAEQLPESTEHVDISPFTDHLYLLVGEDDKAQEYVLNYFAHMIQKPAELPRTALVFKSEQGVGKNMFFEAIGNMILGQNLMLVSDNIDTVIGRFNSNINKLLVIMDEFKGKDGFENSETLKSRITAETVNWEQKGIQSIKIRNYARNIFFGQNPAVKIEYGDRRFNFFVSSSTMTKNSVYFDNLYKTLHDPTFMRAVFNLLKQRDISNWNAERDRVITSAYKDMQSVNKPAMVTFLEERIMEFENSQSFEGEDHVDFTTVPSSELFTTFRHWLNENGFTKLEYNVTKFGRELGSYEGITKHKGKQFNSWKFDFAVLKEGFIKKGY